jgi:hypothetical protein
MSADANMDTIHECWMALKDLGVLPPRIEGADSEAWQAYATIEAVLIDWCDTPRSTAGAVT